MKRLFMIFLAMMVFMCGCSDNYLESSNYDSVATVEEEHFLFDEVSLPIVDPNVLYQDEDFVLYYDGRNNYVDVMNGYDKTSKVPQEYYNYETLLNHSVTSFKSVPVASKNLSINIIAQVDNGREVEFLLYPYKIKTLLPSSLSIGDTHYEYLYKDSETNEVRGYSVFFNKESAMYHSIQGWDSGFDSSAFVSLLEKQNMDDWSYFFSDMFAMNNESEDASSYQFNDGEDYLTLFVDVTMSITYFDLPYDGVLAITLDKNNGTILYSFVGYTKETLENDVVGPMDKRHMLDAICTLYHIS